MNSKTIRTKSLGYPRIGRRRELKKAVESFWKGEISEDALKAAASTLRRHHWKLQREAGIDFIPSNDFSLYDQVLDMTCLLGNIPSRFTRSSEDSIDLDLYFRMARGADEDGETHASNCCGAKPELACEMTKWFDTNYHYLVPEFNESTEFGCFDEKVVGEFLEAKELGIITQPVLIGPLTYLTLGKEIEAREGFDRFELSKPIIEAFTEVLRRLSAVGCKAVQIDEPALGLDLTDRQREIITTAFETFAKEVPEIDLHVATYFSELRENVATLVSLPVAGIHIDAVRAPGEVESIVDAIADSEKGLSLGLIDGRNIWKTNLKSAVSVLAKTAGRLGTDRLVVAPSCSLLHVPVSLKQEVDLDPEVGTWLAFADEKLEELHLLSRALTGDEAIREALLENDFAISSRRSNERVVDPSVQARIASLRPELFQRSASFEDRRGLQREKLNLPAFPTTTIGSFPQTQEVRQARAKFRRGEWTSDQYETFLRLRTSSCIAMQEKAGLDVLVHGEFERNDMVEYFGEQLAGFVFTRYGWVQSYGSRCVKPPIIFGDVSRPKPMTVEWATFAQTKTARPMKGMLTGPVTILQWSFVRDDQSLQETAFQIALSIRDEVLDLERAGIPIIQIDEAAIREGLPLRRDDWGAYFKWAVDAFRLSSAGVRDETQIHTHMCYSEFNDMLEPIAAMDADVITIENARSNLELLEAFSHFAYPNEIGPGVYDIHSPRIPTTQEIVSLLEQAGNVVPINNLWVNPDCGLKTRKWEDVEPALHRMVEAAVQCRAKIA